MSSLRLSAQERREQILVTAIRLFEERPHTEVSTAEIATAAGVARPLVHHYFGTRHELYLEVLRRLYFLPPVDPAGLGGTTTRDRAEQLIDRWLRLASRHRNTWLAFSGVGGPGSDPEVARIVRESDDLTAARLLDAVCGLGAAADDRLRAMVVAWAGLAKSATRQWLEDGALTRDDVAAMLADTLEALLADRAA